MSDLEALPPFSLSDKFADLLYFSQNSDVFLGYVGWAAGSFDNTYELVETPTWNGNSFTDTSLVKACLAR